jgi:hypothetical protein
MFQRVYNLVFKLPAPNGLSSSTITKWITCNMEVSHYIRHMAIVFERFCSIASCCPQVASMFGVLASASWQTRPASAGHSQNALEGRPWVWYTFDDAQVC